MKNEIEAIKACELCGCDFIYNSLDNVINYVTAKNV